MSKNIVSEINIVPVKPKNGLIAFTSFVLFEQLYVNSVAVYTRFGGGIRLVYPRKKNLDICHPISNEFGELVENKVLMEIYKFNLISEARVQ